MRKSRLIALAAALAIVLPLGVALAEVDFAKVMCPLSGKAAKQDKSADYHGRKVYFCCDNCCAKFGEDQAKAEGERTLTAKANLQLAQSGQAVQVGCPMSGKAVKAGTEVEIGGVKVGFCCEHCQAKAKEADAAGQVDLAFKEMKGFTTQTKCPVSGKPIDVKCSTEHDGKKVYFCCPNCKQPFEAEPAKFAEKLK